MKDGKKKKHNIFKANNNRIYTFKKKSQNNNKNKIKNN